MLPRNHRLTRPSEISAVVSRGRKSPARIVVTYGDRVQAGDDALPRCAVIVGKSVGHAPARNLVKRRIRHALAEILRDESFPPGTRCVVRALPASRHAGWSELRDAVKMSMRAACQSA